MRALLAALLFGCSCAAAAAECNTFPWYELSVLHVARGDTLVLDGHFGEEAAGRTFVLRDAPDPVFGDSSAPAIVELKALSWSANQVRLAVPHKLEPAWFEIGVRCADPRMPRAVLGYRGLVRVQGDADSLLEPLLLVLENVPQVRTLWAAVSLAGFFAFLLLFAWPFLKSGLRTLPGAGALAGAAGNFILAASYWVAWWNPALPGREMVTYLVFLMMLEFLLMHASIFFAADVMGKTDAGERRKSMTLLAVVYSICAIGVSVGAKSAWPFLLLWWVMLNRFLPALLRGPAPGMGESHLRRAAPSAFFYLIGAFFCGLYPLPPLGATLSIRGYGQGLWLDEPYRALAFGIFYFVLVGVVELTTPDTKAVRSEGEVEA